MLLSNKYPFLTNYFTELLSSKTQALPQSLLFYGNDFDAQMTIAKEIARFLNCQADKSDNCECLNCKWIREDSHPAVMLISRADNKPDDDDSKTVISIKQSAMIKESLVTASEFHRVFIFCDRDDDGNISGLNQLNFQAETANSLLKIIEEPQPGVTFIFLTRYIDDLLSTIISRSQCFFVPSMEKKSFDYNLITGILDNYWEINRREVFNVSQKLQDLCKENSILSILENVQNYLLNVLKTNSQSIELIEDIKYVEECKKQARLGIRPVNIFDNLCLRLIK